jgi:hypothetical protein
MRTTISTIIATIAMTTTAFAAEGDMAADTGILCWVFLGFCALIVACQMVPAVLLGTAAAKALATNPVKADTKAEIA